MLCPNRKKIIFYVLWLFFFLLPFSKPVNPAHAATLTVNNASGAPGDQDIIIPVYLGNDAGENGHTMQFDLSYDTDKLIFTGWTHGEAYFDGASTIAFDNEGKIRVIVSGFMDSAFVINDGTVINVNFKVQGDAAPGLARLSVSNTKLIDIKFVKIPVTVNNGSITITPTNPTSLTMSFPKGWSLVSVPVRLDNKTVNDIFGDNARVVYGYDKAHGYIRVKPGEELKTGYGYWVCLLEASEYTFTGEPIVSYERDEDAGWHIIGGTSLCGFLSVKNASIGVIYEYKQGKGYVRVEADNIEPSKGYWMLIKDVISGSATFAVSLL